jgi:hypothetical protein
LKPAVKNGVKDIQAAAYNGAHILVTNPTKIFSVPLVAVYLELLLLKLLHITIV